MKFKTNCFINLENIGIAKLHKKSDDCFQNLLLSYSDYSKIYKSFYSDMLLIIQIIIRNLFFVAIHLKMREYKQTFQSTLSVRTKESASNNDRAELLFAHAKKDFFFQLHCGRY